MIRAPFIRLAVLAGASLYVFGLTAVAKTLGLWAALVVLVGGAALALLVSMELENPGEQRPKVRMRR